MTLSPADFPVTVEVDFSGTPYAEPPTFTDITLDVITAPETDGSAPITIHWGRQSWLGDTTPSQCSYTLMNPDGRYTPGNTTSPYYPWVRRRARTHIAVTVDSTTVDLFDGYWDAPTAVPDVTTWYTQVGATDIFGRLGADTPLRGFLIEEMMVDSPTCLYTLQEPEGSVSFADLTGQNNPATSVASTAGEGIIDAGQDPGALATSAVNIPLTGTVVAVTNAEYPHSGGTAVKGTYIAAPANPPIVDEFSFEVWVQTPTLAPVGDQVAWVVGSADFTVPIGWMIHMFAGGELQFAIFEPPSFIPAIRTSSGGYADGQLHHLVGTLSGGTDMKLYVDGVLAASGTAAVPVASLDTGARIRCGLDPQYDDAPFTGGYAYLAMYLTALSSTRVAAHYTAATTAFSGEAVDVNIERLVGYRPNLGVTGDTAVANVGSADCYDVSVQATILADAEADGGGVFADANGQIVFRSRSRLVSPTPVMTLDASAGEVDLPSSFIDDIQNVVNDLTVSSPNNADQRVTDPSSITQDGVCAQSVTVNIDTDAAALDLATWLLGIGTGDQVSCPTLTCNLYTMSSTDQAIALLQLQMLDVVELTNLPPQAPAATMDFVVQGGQVTISTEQFQAELYVTPVPPS